MPLIIFFIFQFFLLSVTFNKSNRVGKRRLNSKKVKRQLSRREPLPILGQKLSVSIPTEEISTSQSFFSKDEVKIEEKTQSFMGFIFSKYSIQNTNEVLQKHGRELELVDFLNSNDNGKMITVSVQIGDMHYKVYCDIDAIRSKVKYENRDYIDEKSVEEVLQYLINNIGMFIPFIIESVRYELEEFSMFDNKKLIKEDGGEKIIENANFVSKIKNNDMSGIVYNDDDFHKLDDFLSYSLLFVNQLKESLIYAVFDSCLANSDLFDKVLTIILYQINKNNNNKDSFVKKNFLSKMVDYVMSLYRYNNIFVIRDNIYEQLHKFTDLDKFYKINNMILLIVLYRIVHFPIVEKKFSLKNFSANPYFLYLLQQSYQYNKFNQFDDDSDSNEADFKLKKSKFIFENIKMFFMPE